MSDGSHPNTSSTPAREPPAAPARDKQFCAESEPHHPTSHKKWLEPIHTSAATELHFLPRPDLSIVGAGFTNCATVR